MARVTRSAAQHSEKDKQPDPSTSARTKQSTKKRKRTSLAASDDQPAPKQLRSDSSIKEETQQDDDDRLTKGKLPELELAGDVPIDSADAQKILDILELVDSQGLLDRVFPLPSSDLSEPSTSKSESGSFSLRALLREPSQYPLRVIRAAVQNLFPISHHPRSRPSSPAAQQLRFCNLACSLLSQASFHSVSLPLDIETLLPEPPESAAGPEAKPRSDKTAQSHQTKKYALVQRLPLGTWWTSLNSDLLPADSKQLKDLSTANAELVAIFPSEPTHAEAGSSETPAVTLGSYVPKKPPGYKPKLPGPRRVSCGAFLDYGPYASFAPVFEQDGVELGRTTMGELFWRWEDRKKRLTQEQSLVVEQSSDEVMKSPRPNGDNSEEKAVFVDQESLEGLFSKEQVTLLKQALGSLELEVAVQELLERNARALKRLEELQIKRLSQPGEFTPVEEGSEEWDTAQGILESLTILTSLRPRLSSAETAPLTPSASALHKLQRTLPIAPTRGWHGTLPADHPTALRDDSTLYIKSTATAIPAAPPPAAPAPTPTPAQPAPTPTTAPTAAAAAQAYAGYSYNFATPYRTAYQYKPGQGTPYYPNAYAAQTSAQAQATSQYYPTQYNATGQQQYTYSSWYQYNPQTQSSTTASGSRKGTPQPSTAATAAPATATTSSAIPTSYAGFFSANAQTTGQRVVANTVLAAASGGKPYQPAAAGTWAAPAAAATGYAAPTLPPHMRGAVVGQAGTAGGYNGTMYQPNYYGTYQATPSPAQS